ncbi:MAG: hypothetical protein C7B45_05340 [Sulfobacillus acidophilus]|uniref:Uncharacterized protein n=1 Tax=Sulfobacillus acidophilus TaxID=53633 RepID=A0A2T2WKI7_9FIRM|nr:MAG: hypothetical protein C7B45_05340 [Sulfobacillus acidophilus]
MRRVWLAGLAGMVLAGGWSGTALAASPVNVPSAAQIAKVMHSYRERGVPGETYTPSLNSLTTTPTPSGHGMDAAVIGGRFPTADGYGQLVFFFDDGRFVGLNSPDEAVAVEKLSAAGPGAFRVTYASYTPHDALDDPTLSPVTITYHVQATGVAASKPLGPTVHDHLGVAQREVAASRHTIQQAVARFREAGVAHETYHPLWNTLLTLPGSGNQVITALTAVRWPTADGYGQVVFFFDGNRFVGLNSPFEASAILRVARAGESRVRITYANYTPDDALDDPTLKPVTITYTVRATGVISSAPLPAGVKNGLRAVLTSGPDR